MKYLLGSLAVAACYLLPGLFNVLVLRCLHPGWWSLRPVRLAFRALPIIGLISGVGWFLSFGLRPAWAEGLGGFAFGSCLLQLVTSGSLALTGGLDGLRRLAARRRASAVIVDPMRRRLWQTGLAAVPLLAAGTSLAGLTEAAARVRIPRLRLEFADLHPDLAGLRILHLSDFHLAGFVSLNTVADILRRARDLSIDLVVVTGDIADDLRLLPDALAQLADFGAPLGTYAVLGNHEYGNGIEKTRDIFRNSRVPLLVDQGVTLRVGRAGLRLGGVDDPAVDRRLAIRPTFFAPRVARIFAGGAAADFRLLLSHRPNAFDAAAAGGVHLTLAGHTHGGQIGLAGRSLLRAPHRYPYPWGEYRNGTSRLYTTSGAGHWVPFRLGCPTEAPVIELVDGGQSASRRISAAPRGVVDV